MSNTKSKKNPIIIICALVLIALITAGYLLVPKGVTAIEMSDNSGQVDGAITVYLDCEDPLTCTIQPAQFADRDVMLEMADPSVAAVDENGVITGASIGETVLKAEAVNFKDKIKVNVLPSVKDIKGIGEKIELTEGRTSDLEAELKVADKSIKAKDVKINYSSDNDKVATVDKDGKITAVEAGDAKITVTAGGCSKTVAVNVKEPVVYRPPASHSRPSSGGSSSHSGGGSSSGGGSGGGWE